MTMAMQCQTFITTSRQCTNKTTDSDGLCHVHKDRYVTGSNGSGTASSIPRVDGKNGRPSMTGHPRRSIGEMYQEAKANRRLRALFLNSLPHDRYLDNSLLQNTKSKVKLEKIIELNQALFPNRQDPQYNSYMVNEFLGMDEGILTDLSSVKHHLLSDSLAILDAQEFRTQLLAKFGGSPNEPVPNFAAHYVVHKAVRTLPDSFHDYWGREGLADTVHTHPDHVEEIVEYVTTHEYMPHHILRLSSRKYYDHLELARLFTHNALNDGVL